MIFNKIGEVFYLFDAIATQQLMREKRTIKKLVEDWLLEKQASFHGDAYIEKLEGNLIYLNEGSYGISQIITRYLREGEPRFWSPTQVDEYVLGARTFFGKVNQECYLQFLRKGTKPAKSPLSQEQHSLQQALSLRPITLDLNYKAYEKLRNRRNNGDLPRYIDELEFCCKIYQGCLLVATAYLKILGPNPEMACSARFFAAKDVLDAVDQRVYTTTMLLLDLRTIST